MNNYLTDVIIETEKNVKLQKVLNFCNCNINIEIEDSEELLYERNGRKSFRVEVNESSHCDLVNYDHWPANWNVRVYEFPTNLCLIFIETDDVAASLEAVVHFCTYNVSVAVYDNEEFSCKKDDRTPFRLEVTEEDRELLFNYEQWPESWNAKIYDLPENVCDVFIHTEGTIEKQKLLNFCTSSIDVEVYKVEQICYKRSSINLFKLQVTEEDRDILVDYEHWPNKWNVNVERYTRNPCDTCKVYIETEIAISEQKVLNFCFHNISIDASLLEEIIYEESGRKDFVLQVTEEDRLHLFDYNNWPERWNVQIGRFYEDTELLCEAYIDTDDTVTLQKVINFCNCTINIDINEAEELLHDGNGRNSFMLRISQEVLDCLLDYEHWPRSWRVEIGVFNDE